MQSVLASVRHSASLRRGFLFSLACLCLIACAMWVLRIRKEVGRQVERERARLEKQDTIPFDRSIRPRLDRPEIRFWQSTREIRDLARFNDSYFAATTGGLIEIDAAGRLVHHYTILDGLAESDLTSLAVYDARLYVGTRTRGLLSFDGERFEAFHWRDREPLSITALMEMQGRLLIGTFAGGLIEFDGSRFRELKTGPGGKRISALTCLAKDSSRLYAGTFDDGLWVVEAGRWLHLTTLDGLLSNRVVGVVTSGRSVVVGSDFGVSSAPASSLMLDDGAGQQKRFRAVATVARLSGLIALPDRILLCQDDGELFDISGDLTNPGATAVLGVTWKKPMDLQGCRLAIVGDELWLMSNQDLWRAKIEDRARDAASGSISLSPVARREQGRCPATNIITSLSFDPDERLWAGSFRNGVDVCTREGAMIEHLESDGLREVNFLIADRDSRSMLAATSEGVMRFDSTHHPSAMTTKNGLLSNSVSGIAFAEPPSPSDANPRPARNAGAVYATSKGLSIEEAGGLRALTTVEGLPSNSVYTALGFGRSIYVGTLSGLAELESGRVVRTFKDSNSSLTHNWITALCAVGPRLFVGAYGGGVFELTAAGDLRGFASETGKLVVNPNALWSDGERLYAGTLDGVWIYELRSQKWTHWRDELPSPVVLSITGKHGFVYLGTTSGVARIEMDYLSKSAEGERPGHAKAAG